MEGVGAAGELQVSPLRRCAAPHPSGQSRPPGTPAPVEMTDVVVRLGKTDNRKDAIQGSFVALRMTAS